MERPLKVLVCDNDYTILRIFQDYLTIEGYDVTVVDNGREAVQKVRTDEFDVLFLDLLMPDMNGAETFTAIKNLGKKILVVIMTAFAHSYILEETKMQGAKIIFYKPFDIEKIGDFLKKISENGFSQSTADSLRQALDYRTVL